MLKVSHQIEYSVTSDVKGTEFIGETQITALNVENILNGSNSFEFRKYQNFKSNYSRNNYNSFNSSSNQSAPMDLGNIENGNWEEAEIAIAGSADEREDQLNVMKKSSNKKTFGKRSATREMIKLRLENKCFKYKNIVRNCRGVYKEN